jgi:predicted nucleic acid-binding protein
MRVVIDTNVFVSGLMLPASVPGDRDGDVILATLVAAKADWLVTGDAALLALADKYPIITPAEFAALLLS